MCHNILKSTQTTLFSKLFSSTAADLKSYQTDSDFWAIAIKEEMSILMAQQIQEQGSHLRILSKFSRSETWNRKLQQRLRLLDACSTYDHQTSWKEVRRCGDTDWFSHQDQYKNFKHATDRSRTLVYSGRLGSGKSIALANMVDDLNLDQSHHKWPVIYFFCRHDVPDSLEARTVIGSLARQLLCTVQTLNTVPEDLEGNDLPGSEHMIELLQRNLDPERKAYLILDGLDECSAKQEREIMKNLRSLQKLCPLMVCLSSRQEAGTAASLRPEQLTKPDTLTIPEDNPDIAKYIEAEIDNRVESGVLVVGDPILVLEIRDALLEGAQGMFLWVVLQMNSLCMEKTDEAIRNALADLPRDLPSIFCRILQQSAALGQEYQTRTLEFITAAYRPLTTDELREALGVVVGVFDWNPARMPNDIYTVLECCGSLVVVDEETKSVRLIHPSVKQYLYQSPDGTGISVSHKGFNMDSVQAAMIATIATYANYNVFDTRLATTNEAGPQQKVYGEIPQRVMGSVMDSTSAKRLALKLLRSREPLTLDLRESLLRVTEPRSKSCEDLPDFAFLQYAQRYWYQHANMVSELDVATYRSLSHAIDRKTLEFKATTVDFMDISTPPDFDEVSADLLRLMIEKKFPFHLLPGIHRNEILFWAAKRGHGPLVGELLDGKDSPVDVNAQDDQGRTPLSWVAEGGHIALLQLLISRGADTNLADKSGRTPLSRAAEKGHDLKVQILLMHGANVNHNLGPGGFAAQLPVSYAAMEGKVSTVQLLTQAGAVINYENDKVAAPLVWAARNGHENVVGLLLDKGARLNANGASDRRTPLSWAAGEGHEGTVHLLLACGADVERADPIGTPLHWAAGNGCDGTVELLIERGATVDSLDPCGSTPLMLAARAGNESTVKLLLGAGAKKNARDDLDRMALSYAAEQGHEAVVRILMDRSAYPEDEGPGQRTPLSWAAQAGQDGLVRLLADDGNYDVNTRASDDTTPLMQAAMGGHALTVKTLLDRGADFNAQDKGGYTALSWAATKGRLGATRALITHGLCEKKHLAAMSQSALMLAAEKGHVDVVQLLLDEGGAILDKKGARGRTALMVAARNGQEHVMELLLARGASVTTKDDSGTNAGSGASFQGYEFIATRLRAIERGESSRLARGFTR